MSSSATLHASTLRSAIVSAGVLPYSIGTFFSTYGDRIAVQIVVVVPANCYVYGLGRASVFSALSRGILKGTLVVIDDDGTYSFGEAGSKESGPVVTMRIHSGRVWTRIIMSNDLGGRSPACSLPA